MLFFISNSLLVQLQGLALNHQITGSVRDLVLSQFLLSFWNMSLRHLSLFSSLQQICLQVSSSTIRLHDLITLSSIFLTALGTDYIYQRTPVMFLPGEKSGDAHMIFIDIRQDTVVEDTESFQFSLSCQNPLAFIDDERRESTIYITDQTSMLNKT